MDQTSAEKELNRIERELDAKEQLESLRQNKVVGSVATKGS